MQMIAHKIVGAGDAMEESRKRLLEAKRSIYLKIRARLAKERPETAVCSQTQRRKCYDYSHLVRTYS